MVVQVLASEQEKREQTKLTILGVWQEMVRRCSWLSQHTEADS